MKKNYKQAFKKRKPKIKFNPAVILPVIIVILAVLLAALTVISINIK